MKDRTDEEERVDLYARLPLLASDAWWLRLGRTAEHVLELGAGVGRLTEALLAEGTRVTAVEKDPGMLRALRARVGDGARVIDADVTDLPFDVPCDLVLLPSSLLNELADVDARRAVLTQAARCCHRDGRVALHVLGPWWLVHLSGSAAGQLQAADGREPVEVTVTASGLDAWPGRRAADLVYRFSDGARFVDRLDAAIITGAELELLCAAAGLEIVHVYGAQPPAEPTSTDGAWHIVARPRR